MFVTQDEYKNRLNICQNCNHRETTLMINICGLCGCAIRAKAIASSQFCPDNRWTISSSKEEKKPNDSI